MSTINATQSHRQQSFVMIKPDGVQRNLIGEIITRFERVGLKLVALKMIVPDLERLTTHYSKSDEWYESKGQKTVDNLVKRGIEPTKPAMEYGKDIIRALLTYMSSGPAILMIWEGNKAMEVVKKLVGGTEPTTSDIGTIRGDYTLDSYDKATEDNRAVRNLMHCTDPADGMEEAIREINIWFKQEEIVNYRHVQEAILYDPEISEFCCKPMQTHQNVFKKVPTAGTAFIMEKASKLGFYAVNPEWANLGQGAPELLEIEGDFPRITEFSLPLEASSYSPVGGIKGLREQVANYYNELFRKDFSSKYTYKNVLITPGGRAGLTRIFATMGKSVVGNFSPDYTTYEEILDFPDLINKVSVLSPENGFEIELKTVRDFVENQGLQALLFSSPSNPTGYLTDELKAIVEYLEKKQIVTVFDEFYSRLVYSDRENVLVSSNQYLEDVNSPILILDGFTKGWRYPGWRLSWVLGPEDVIDNLISASSFLDGGPSRIAQEIALKHDLLNTEKAIPTAKALSEHFKMKRDYFVSEITKLGLKVDHPPEGALYVWANLDNLPAPLNEGYGFFEACLKEKLIVAPGELFDIRPKEEGVERNFKNYVRFSFAPKMEVLKVGVENLKRVLQ